MKKIIIVVLVFVVMFCTYNLSMYFWEPKEGEVLVDGCVPENRDDCLYKGKISIEPWTANYIIEDSNGKVVIIENERILYSVREK